MYGGTWRSCRLTTTVRQSYRTYTNVWTYYGPLFLVSAGYSHFMLCLVGFVWIDFGILIDKSFAHRDISNLPATFQ